MKAIKTEIKENVQGTNSEEKETGTQINDLEKKEIFNHNRMKKQKFKKMRKGLGASGTLNTLNLNHRDASRRGRARNGQLI